MFTTVITAAILSSLVSLSASYVFLLSENGIRRWTPSLLAVACGVLLGDAFFHLMPEAFEISENSEAALGGMLLGIVIFFCFEQFVKSRQHQRELEEGKSLARRLPYMNLAGDALHNATDGVLIATSFMADTKLGIATTLAIVLHEIPQELTDIALLIRGGWSKSKAFQANFYCALIAPLAAIGTLIFDRYAEVNLGLLLSITAGGFVYIALANLMPMLLPARGNTASIPQFGTVLIGLLSMQMLLWVE